MYVCEDLEKCVSVVSRKIEKYASVRKELLQDIEDIHTDIHRADKVHRCMYVSMSISMYALNAVCYFASVDL